MLVIVIYRFARRDKIFNFRPGSAFAPPLGTGRGGEHWPVTALFNGRRKRPAEIQDWRPVARSQ